MTSDNDLGNTEEVVFSAERDLNNGTCSVTSFIDPWRQDLWRRIGAVFLYVRVRVRTHKNELDILEGNRRSNFD
ncbi:MAG: hypothetical protein LBC11_02120 [Puniceicoccales bacterium]|nr:hypothetical protein [Puniceicoccales bacterium]